jgi:hypothetical protein
MAEGRERIVSRRPTGVSAPSHHTGGDAANYAISLSVTGMALTWRARAAHLKGYTLFALGLWVMATTALHAGTLPKPN